MKKIKIAFSLILFTSLCFLVFVSRNEVFGSSDKNSVADNTEETSFYETEETVLTEEDLKEKEEFEELQKQIIDNRKNVSDITNILLLGEENMDENVRGRSDLIMVVSLNNKTKSVKMISFLRDMLVDIDGHNKNKLNSAYAFGGVDLLKDTLEKNFLINIDYYAKVNFDDFEKIIDALGGIDIYITEEESKYLNISNYISNELYRTTVPGINHFNGNQALGFSRVRYVQASDGELYDFGRTYRQRMVMNAIYSKFKEQSFVNMLKVGNSIFSNLDTDINYLDVLSMLSILKDLNLEDIETYRIPMDGKFTDDTYENMSVLIYDKSNIEELNKIIYI